MWKQILTDQSSLSCEEKESSPSMANERAQFLVSYCPSPPSAHCFWRQIRMEQNFLQYHYRKGVQELRKLCVGNCEMLQYGEDWWEQVIFVLKGALEQYENTDYRSLTVWSSMKLLNQLAWESYCRKMMQGKYSKQQRCWWLNVSVEPCEMLKQCRSLSINVLFILSP